MRSPVDFSESPAGDWEPGTNEFDLASDKDDVDGAFVAPGSVGRRAKALVLAAICVWELKRGIHD